MLSYGLELFVSCQFFGKLRDYFLEMDDFVSFKVSAKVVWPFSSTVILEKETAPSVVSITATGGSELLADLISSWNCTAYFDIISWKAGDCLYPAAAFLKQRAFRFTPFNTGYLEEDEYILGLRLEISGDLDDWHGRRKSYRR
jgi:hypothetical protein